MGWHLQTTLYLGADLRVLSGHNGFANSRVMEDVYYHSCRIGPLVLLFIPFFFSWSLHRGEHASNYWWELKRHVVCPHCYGSVNENRAPQVKSAPASPLHPISSYYIMYSYIAGTLHLIIKQCRLIYCIAVQVIGKMCTFSFGANPLHFSPYVDPRSLEVCSSVHNLSWYK